MHDRLQVVIQHPFECPNKGSSIDKRKTFHMPHHALDVLTTCGEPLLTAEQQAVFNPIGQAVQTATR